MLYPYYRCFIALIAVLLSTSNSWAAKEKFYVPPILRFDLDPVEWELPYLAPYYYDAVSFRSGQPVELTSRKSKIKIKIFISYFEDAQNPWLTSYSSDYKAVKDMVPEGDFGAWQTRYVDVANKGQLIWISEKIPNVRVVVSTTARVDQADQVAEARAFIATAKWVSPQEIDEAVGYPMQKSQLEDIKVQRANLVKGNQQNSMSYRAKPSAPIRDVLFGFSYQAYHEAELKIIRKSVPRDLVLARALGIGPLDPWLLRDSMHFATTSYSSYSSEKYVDFRSFERETHPPFAPFQRGQIMAQKERKSICKMSRDTITSYWICELDAQNVLHINKTSFPLERWEMRDYVYYRTRENNSFDQITFAEGQSRFVLCTGYSNTPQLRGTKELGRTTYVFDTQNPDLGWVLLAPWQDKVKRQFRMYQKRIDPNSYSSSEPFAIFESAEIKPFVYEFNPYDDQNRDLDELRMAFAERSSVDPKTMIVCSDWYLLDLDQDGQKEHWRFWISDGQLIQWTGYLLRNEGMQTLEGESFKNQLLEKKEVQDLLTLSKKGYGGYSRYKTSDFEKRMPPPSEASPKAEKQEKKTPFVSIVSSHLGPLSFFDEAAAERLKAQCKLPADFKKAGQPVMVAFHVTINDNNRISQLTPLNKDPQLSALYAEAKRLAPLLPSVNLPPPSLSEMEYPSYPNRKKQEHHYTLLFYFAP